MLSYTLACFTLLYTHAVDYFVCLFVQMYVILIHILCHVCFRYYQSRSISQLQGEELNEGDVELACTPLYKNGSQLLNPCGLVANSFFTGRWCDYLYTPSPNPNPIPTINSNPTVACLCTHKAIRCQCAYRTCIPNLILYHIRKPSIDMFSINTGLSTYTDLTLDETDIALPSDKTTMFNQVTIASVSLISTVCLAYIHVNSLVAC
ncbi:hypothetical protein EON65_03070 [archaeon]|nr:MAG: hypothetical protein EON65_03070 [archaeon]